MFFVLKIFLGRCELDNSERAPWDFFSLWYFNLFYVSTVSRNGLSLGYSEWNTSSVFWKTPGRLLEDIPKNSGRLLDDYFRNAYNSLCFQNLRFWFSFHWFSLSAVPLRSLLLLPSFVTMVPLFLALCLFQNFIQSNRVDGILIKKRG